MGDTNGSQKFLTQTLPAIVGPALLAMLALGIWYIAQMSAQIDAQASIVDRIPTIERNQAGVMSQLASLTEQVAQLRQVTQGLDGSLRPEGTLSAEVKAISAAVVDAARQQQATRDQLNALIVALGRSRQGLPAPQP